MGRKLVMIKKLKKNKIIRTIFSPLIFIKKLLWRMQNQKKIQYDNLFSNVESGSLVVTIKGISGKFEIDCRSHILQRILVNKTYEEEIVNLLAKYIPKDKDAINVGANVGIFTVVIASLLEGNGKVLSVEPTPNAFYYLQKNIERNGLKNKVLLFNGICADRPGEYNLNTIKGKEEYSSVGESIHMQVIGEDVSQITVAGETVDNLVETNKLNPGLIFIDAEGSEMKVLQGAEKIFGKYKPVIITELDDGLLVKQGTSAKNVVEYLEKNNYDVFDIHRNKTLTYPFSGNVIAINSK